MVVFDLDGTLLNGDAVLSTYTVDTLGLMAEQGIAYTIATGRTLHGARSALEGHTFHLPQAYKNGVMIWHPDLNRLVSGATLTPEEVTLVLEAFEANGVTPFVYSISDCGEESIYHPPIRTQIEREVGRRLGVEWPGAAGDLDDLPAEARISHINAVGASDAILSVIRSVDSAPHLIAFSGTLFEEDSWRWLDIHHADASKGGAVTELKHMLSLERVICFGDSDNDLSMFSVAEESYATANANSAVKAAASEVIGHHNEDGVARFLRTRFSL